MEEQDERNNENDDQPVEIICVRLHERNGKAFKIVQLNPYGHWQVRHASNVPCAKEPVNAYFTSVDEAIKAINRIPAEDIKPTTRKVILTPKTPPSLLEG